MVDTAFITRHDTRAAQVAGAVHDALNPVQTILFGSRARGTHRPDSDIDLLILTAEETHRTTGNTPREWPSGSGRSCCRKPIKPT